MSDAARHSWRIAPDREIVLDRPILMGILNVTPDSFSDGGLYSDVDSAVDAARRMVAEGASIIDVGGESTRPGAQRIGAEEQLRRVLPVIEKLRAQSNVAISIDTTLSEVARAATGAGASIINDVAAGRDDPRILELVAERGCGLILMHRLRPPEQDSYSTHYGDASRPEYLDVVAQVAQFLEAHANEAIRAGVGSDQIVIDPGLGFGKTVEQNHLLIAGIAEIAAIGYPVLCAVSRKSFLDPGGSMEPRDRVTASVAAAMSMHRRGVRLFRVHDVAAHREALAAASATRAASTTREPHNPLRL